MYFGLLPPEINSGLMYAGPGSGSMLAAATAWDGLAADLHATAAAYSSVLSGLTTQWRGPSATSMASAAAPYVAWISATAAQAEQTATQARSAAAAYEAAFAATVPPPVIEANRSEMESLTATNIFGQNSPAIAATEAQYSQMWARDAVAMSSYATQSAAATQVEPFAVPLSTANPSGLLGRLLQTLQTFATAIGSSTQTQFSQLFGAIPTALQSLGTIVTGPNPASGLLTALQDFAGLQTLSSISADVEMIPKFILPANSVLINTIMGLVIGTKGLEGANSASAAAAGSTQSSLAAGVSGMHLAGAAGPGRPGRRDGSAAELGCRHPGDQNGRLRVVGRGRKRGGGRVGQRGDSAQWNGPVRHGRRSFSRRRALRPAWPRRTTPVHLAQRRRG